MPETAKALSRRLGLPYRPDLLAGNDAAARKYQDALTEAATREAWQFGRGNPDLAARYYFAGPDRGKWGAKTRRYASDILARLGGN